MLLRSKKGISLLEIILTLLITTLVLSSVLGVYKQRIQRAHMDQTISDMLAIADAALTYNSSTGNWPTNIAELTPAFLPTAVLQNAFGDLYALVCATGKVSVSSIIPAGLAKNTALGSLMEVSPAGEGNERVTITKREQIGALGRLRYDKKYIYHE